MSGQPVNNPNAPRNNPNDPRPGHAEPRPGFEPNPPGFEPNPDFDHTPRPTPIPAVKPGQPVNPPHKAPAHVDDTPRPAVESPLP